MTKYRVPVIIEVELDVVGDEEAVAPQAVAAVDETLQRAWDTDQGRKWNKTKWHFEIEPDISVEVVDG